MQIPSALPSLFSPVIRANSAQQAPPAPAPTAPDAPATGTTRTSPPAGAQDLPLAGVAVEDSEKLLSQLKSERPHHVRHHHHHHHGEHDDKKVAKALKESLKPVIKELKHEAKHLRRELGPGTEEGREVKDLYKDLRTATRDAIKSTKHSGVEGLDAAAADIQTAFETFAAGLKDIIARANGTQATPVEAGPVLAYDIAPAAPSTPTAPVVSSPLTEPKPAPVSSSPASVPVVSPADAAKLAATEPATGPAIQPATGLTTDPIIPLPVADSIDEAADPLRIDHFMVAIEQLIKDGLGQLADMIAALQADPPRHHGHHFGHNEDKDTDVSSAYSLATGPTIGHELDQAA